MDSEEMKRRTKQFAINVAKLVHRLPDTAVNKAYKGQNIRSAVQRALTTGLQGVQNQRPTLLIN